MEKVLITLFEPISQNGQTHSKNSLVALHSTHKRYLAILNPKQSKVYREFSVRAKCGVVSICYC